MSLSLLDNRRLETLKTLLRDIDARNVQGDVLEVGVYMGGSLEFICQHTKRSVTGADTFGGMPKTKDCDDHKEGDFQSDFDNVANLLKPYPHCKLVKGLFPDCFVGNKQTFALVHLDVDIYDSVKNSLEFLWSKISNFGYVVIDDYGASGCFGARVAVNEFLGKVLDQAIVINRVLCQLTIQKMVGSNKRG